MRTVLQTAVNAVAVLSIQLLALITLQPADFGSFSILYLAFALGSSLSLSMVSEAWLRVDLRGGGAADWTDYSSVSSYLAAVTGLLACGLALVVEPLRPVAVIGSVAVAASVYRATARYFAVRVGDHRGVLPADIIAAVIAVGGWGIAYAAGARDLMAIVVVWAASAVGSAVFSRWPGLHGPRVIGRWWRVHDREISHLLRDSLLLDAGSIGTPYLLAPALGLESFGIYRAVSNTAAPVRLVLNPIRPKLAAVPSSAQRSIRMILVVAASSAAFGLLAYLGLWLVDVLGLQLGSLTELVAFAVPTGVFVGANFLGHYYYIVARSHASGRRLLTGRIIQTTTAIAAPIIGFVLAGLDGAIWGYAGATVSSSATWWILVMTASPEDEQPTPTD